MRIDILTILPELIESPLNHSIIKRAKEKGIVEIVVNNIRNYSRNKQKQVIAIVLDRNPLINTRAGLIIRTIRVFAMVELTLCVRVMAPEVFIP